MANKSRLAVKLVVLKNRSDFLKILRNGKRVTAAPWLVLNFLGNEEGSFRCGWTLPRKVGSAVVRNRLKRWSRVYFRGKVNATGDLPLIDINLVFRQSEDDFFKKLKYEQFSEVLDKAWTQVGRRAGR